MPSPATSKGPTELAGHRVDRSTLPLLLTLGLGVFAGALDLGVLSPALPAIGKQFSIPDGNLAWIFTIYLLVTIVSIAVAATLADRLGRRPIYMTCITVFALGSLAAVFAPNYPVFLLARAIQALGAGGIFPVATATIGDVVPSERRGAALGIVAATWGVAAIIGPAFGGLITHLLSWRWIFILNFPLAATVLVLARTHVPSRAAHARGPLDIGGLTLLAGGLLALMLGIQSIAPIPILLGIVLLGGFVQQERRSRNPVVPLSIFATPQLAKTYGLELLIGILEGSLFFVPTVLVGAQGLSYATAGGIAALGALAFVTIIPISGRALDRIGSRDVLLTGALFTEAGLLIFALGFGSLPLAILAMLVAGAGFGALLGAPTRYIVTTAVATPFRATAVGLLSQMLIIGQILGSSLAGGIMNAASNELLGYRAAYLTFSAVALLALALAGTLAARHAEASNARAVEQKASGPRSVEACNYDDT
ncbi:MAG: MFS transporter [Vulcanimicrobiaceae bacterium]